MLKYVPRQQDGIRPREYREGLHADVCIDIYEEMLKEDNQTEEPEAFNHKHLYRNSSDLDVICEILKINGKVSNYAVEQKTLSGQIKCAIVNYELIDYFGEKSILSGAADITEIKRLGNESTVYAFTDVLTGVLNRRAGMELIKKQV